MKLMHAAAAPTTSPAIPNFLSLLPGLAWDMSLADRTNPVMHNGRQTKGTTVNNAPLIDKMSPVIVDLGAADSASIDVLEASDLADGRAGP
jgi:hypothetical protein